MAALLKFCSLFALGCGVFVLMQVVLPMATYQVWEWRTMAQNAPLIGPEVQQNNGFSMGQVLGVSVAQANNDLTSNLRYVTRTSKPSYDTFTLSIPKLNISQAIVKIDGDSPDRSLILLQGTALPGEKGNMFIAGHSNYWQLFGPDNWYLSIFKNLTDLQPGDQIIATAQGQNYVYKVKSLKVVDPKNTSVMIPPTSQGRYISIMTCVPPGTFMKRLIVLGELQ